MVSLMWNIMNSAEDNRGREGRHEARVDVGASRSAAQTQGLEAGANPPVLLPHWLLPRPCHGPAPLLPSACSHAPSPFWPHVVLRAGCCRLSRCPGEAWHEQSAWRQ